MKPARSRDSTRRLAEHHPVGAPERHRVVRGRDQPGRARSTPSRGTGLKKCIPSNPVRPRRRDAEIAIGIEDVLLARIASRLGDLVEAAEHPDLGVVILGRGLDRGSTSARSCTSVVRECVRAPPRARRRRAVSVRPRGASRVSMRFRPRSTSSSLVSSTTALLPRPSHDLGDPEPIRPHPMTPTVRTSSARIAPCAASCARLSGRQRTIQPSRTGEIRSACVRDPGSEASRSSARPRPGWCSGTRSRI